jgi:hypothetical protein
VKETDEVIYVYYRRFHKYASEPLIDSVWSERRETLSQEKEFNIVSDTQWRDSSTYYLETVVSDTNSARHVMSRSIFKGGVMYSLKTEIEADRPLSPFVKEFYASFEPWDTTIGYSLLESKAELFLSDLKSEDSLTREGAFNSLNVVDFEDGDAPRLISAFRDQYAPEHSMAVREHVLNNLAHLDHPDVMPYLNRVYYEIGDTVQFQLPILAGISSLKTKKSTKLFLEMLEDEVPLTEESYELSRMFYPFGDSLELAEELYPDLFKFSSLPEYKYKVYYYLARSKDSGHINKKHYRGKVKEIAWEANNEAKRMKSTEAGYEPNYLDENNRYKRYEYDYSLYNYAVLLLPYLDCKSNVDRYFERLEKMQSPGLRMDVAILKAKNGIEVPAETWREFAENDNDRIELYEGLKKVKLLHLFPSEYKNQGSLALSHFADLNNLNASRDTITFVKKVHTIIQKDTGYIYFFKFKSRYGDDWKMGYLGLQGEDTTVYTLDIDYSSDYMSYSKFEDLDLQLNMQIRKLQMEGRERYRVLDERRFKILDTRRSYYGYY